MENELKIKMHAPVLDCKDPFELASFYAALLKWIIVYPWPDPAFDAGTQYVEVNFIMIGSPEAYRQGMYPRIAFQRNPEYLPPVWPEKPEAQQQMAHIDFVVNDLEKAVQHAIQCGATIASEQFSEKNTVMLDPAGHPFCLGEMKSEMEKAHFALL
jgi:catechol 2,3-dioxygenase-like lactoylglutathione lyase family enzyme